MARGPYSGCTICMPAQVREHCWHAQFVLETAGREERTNDAGNLVVPAYIHGLHAQAGAIAVCQDHS